MSRTPVPVRWSDLTDRLPGSAGWMHSGVAVDENGTVFCAHQDGGAVVVLAADGGTRVQPTPLAELHGLALGSAPGVLAAADPGYRMGHDDRSRYSAAWTPGRAVLLGIEDGSVVLELPQPPLSVYAQEPWRPTDIDLDQARSDGDIWVADGYGANLVHRYSSSGQLLATIDGTESGLAFDCPHGLLLRVHDGVVEVLIADRGNHRIVVLDREGRYLRVFGEDSLDSPSGMTELDGDLYVTELFGGVARFDRHDTFLETLETRRVRSHLEADWPNAPGAEPGALAAPGLVANAFNSPHGIAAHRGDLYVTEWMIGGRLLRLTPNA